MKSSWAAILVFSTPLTAIFSCGKPLTEWEYISSERGAVIHEKPAADASAISHALFGDPVKTGESRGQWKRAQWKGDAPGWIPVSSVSRVDPWVALIREKAAPSLHRNTQDVGVQRLEGGMYEVTHFALVNGDQRSATIYDLWRRSENRADKVQRLGPARNLIQLKLNRDDLWDYLVEGGVPGTGREFVAAFLGNDNGTVQKADEVSAPSDEAPRITSHGRCEKTIIEVTSAKLRRFHFDCASKRFTSAEL